MMTIATLKNKSGKYLFMLRMMSLRQSLRMLVLCLAALALTACGGGGGGSMNLILLLILISLLLSAYWGRVRQIGRGLR